MQTQIVSHTVSELEELADQIKVVTLLSLVDDQLVKEEDAEHWAENHTVLFKRKSFFRTLTNKWLKTKEEEGFYILVVAKKEEVSDNKS